MTLRSIQRLQLIDLLCEGPIGGLVNGLKSVYLDGVPIEAADGTRNITGVQFAMTKGTPGQTAEALPAANVVQTERAVQLKVEKAVPVTRAITDPNVNAVRVTLAVPQLTSQGGNGSLEGASVEYAIEVQSAGGGFNRVSLGSEQITLASASGDLNTGGRNVVAASINVRIDRAYSNAVNINWQLQQRLAGGAWANVPGASGQNVSSLRRTVTLANLAPGVYEWRIVTGTYGYTSSGSQPSTASISGTATTIANTATISGKATSAYKRDVVIQLPGSAPWDVRVRRISDDSTSDTLVNALYWDTYTEIQHLRLAYKHCAVAGLMVDAGSNGAAPARAYDLLLQLVQVPSNYDPITRVYTGIWDGTFKEAWTDNPAWVFYAVATNTRWGLGRELGVGKISKWALYKIAQYCDALVPDGRGGTEPRFTINCQILDRQQARTLLQQLAGTMRALAFAAGDQVHLVQDAPASVDFIYGRANVAAGDFNYQGVSRQTRSSVFVVYWNDLSQMGRPVPEAYTSQELVRRFGVKEKVLRPLGVISRGQAARLARWAAYSEEYEGETVTFRVGAGGTLVRPGRVFQINDPNEAGERLGGLLRSATTTVLTLDAPVDLPALQEDGSDLPYTVTVQLANPANPADMVTETRYISTRGAAVQAITVAPPFSVAPDAQTPWLIDSPTVAPTTWRCLNVAEVAGHDKDEYELIGVAHNPAKFAAIEQGLMLEARPISRVSVIAPRVDHIDITETAYLVGTLYRSRATVSWPEPVPGLLYELQWRNNYGPWTTLPATGSATVDVEGLVSGQFDVLLRTRNALGNTAPVQAAGIQLVGKVGPCSDVTGLEAKVVQGGVLFTWNASPDAAYLRTVLTINGEAKFTEPGKSFFLPWPALGTYAVSAVHWDTSFNTSATPATLSVVVDDAMLIQWATLAGAPTTANLIRNPSFAAVVGEWNPADTFDASAAGVPPGAPSKRVLRSTQRDYYARDAIGATVKYPVQPNEELEIETWVGLNTALPVDVGFVSFSYGLAGNDLLSYPGASIPGSYTGWRKVVGQIKVGPTQYFITPTLWIGQNGQGYEGWFSEPVLRRLPASVAAAKATADAAAQSASQALQQLADAGSDNMLTPGEKPEIILKRDVLLAVQSANDAQAAIHGITTERTAYNAALAALVAHLATLTAPVPWYSTVGNTAVSGTALYNAFKTAYNAQSALLNAIATGTKAAADAAATTATWSGVSGSGKPEDNATVGANASNLRIGLGINLCRNSDFAQGLATGWTSNPNGFSPALYVNYDPVNWALNKGVGEGTGTLGVNQSGAPVGGYFELWSEPIVVEGGKRYAVSAYTGAHRCRVDVFVYYRDAAGVAIGNFGADQTYNDQAASGGTQLVGYMRHKQVATLPVGAATAHVILRKWGHQSPNTDSWMFVTRVMFEQVPTGATEPGYWSPPGVGQALFQAVAAASLNAENTAKAYAEAQAQLAATEAKAHADGLVDAEEQRAIQDAANKAETARQAAVAAAAADATAKANLAATTATWGGVIGLGKPADNATRNFVFYQDADPAGLAADGDLWQTVSAPSREFKRVGGAWVATVGPGSVNTAQIQPGAVNDTVRFYDAAGVGHYVSA